MGMSQHLKNYWDLIFLYLQFIWLFNQIIIVFHLACFHILIIESNDVMNIGAHVSFWIGVFGFLGIKPEVSLVNLNLVLLFWEISLLFSIVAIPIYISTDSIQCSLFFMVFVNFCYLYIFDGSPLRLSFFQLNSYLFEFMLSYKCCLYILNINPLLVITFSNIFSFSRLSFYFVSGFFGYTKILNLIRSHWFIFAFTYFTLCKRWKKYFCPLY